MSKNNQPPEVAAHEVHSILHAFSEVWGLNGAQVAAEVGVTKATLYGWKKQGCRDHNRNAMAWVWHKKVERAQGLGRGLFP